MVKTPTVVPESAGRKRREEGNTDVLGHPQWRHAAIDLTTDTRMTPMVLTSLAMRLQWRRQAI
jgi:hypothetical protein